MMRRELSTLMPQRLAWSSTAASISVTVPLAGPSSKWTDEFSEAELFTWNCDSPNGSGVFVYSRLTSS